MNKMIDTSTANDRKEKNKISPTYIISTRYNFSPIYE